MPSATPPDPTKRKRGRPRKWTGVPDGFEPCTCLLPIDEITADEEEPDFSGLVLRPRLKVAGQAVFARKDCPLCHADGIVKAKPPEPERCSCGLPVGPPPGGCFGPLGDAIDLKHLMPGERERGHRHGYQGKAWKDVACSACDGLGRVAVDSDLECQRCGGTGRLEDELRIAAEAHPANPGDELDGEAGEDRLTDEERKVLAKLAAAPATAVHEDGTSTTVHEAFDAEIADAVRVNRAWELFRESWTSGRTDADQLAAKAFAAVDTFMAAKGGAK